jgi:hypothetical protein
MRPATLADVGTTYWTIVDDGRRNKVDRVCSEYSGASRVVWQVAYGKRHTTKPELVGKRLPQVASLEDITAAETRNARREALLHSIRVRSEMCTSMDTLENVASSLEIKP